MKQTGRVALGGVLGALSLVVMLLTVIPTATYALPAIAGLLLVPLVIEWGIGAGFSAYAAVAILSMILAPDKEAAFLFVAFFGHYPILKAVIEKNCRHKSVIWIIKLILFNGCMILAYWLLSWLFHFSMDAFAIGGVNVAWAFLAAGNPVFVLYDIAMSRVISLYWYRLRDRLMRLFQR